MAYFSSSTGGLGGPNIDPKTLADRCTPLEGLVLDSSTTAGRTDEGLVRRVVVWLRPMLDRDAFLLEVSCKEWLL